MSKPVDILQVDIRGIVLQLTNGKYYQDETVRSQPETLAVVFRR